MLLRAGDATLFGRKPPVIKLNQWSTGAPEPERIYFRTGNEIVAVVDLEGAPLAPTFSAKAAQLLKDSRATLIKSATPTIRLNRVVANRPKEANQMEQRYTDSQGRVVNWTAFFKEERDIYVRNLTDCNISLTIGSGEDATFVQVPRSPDPINLTAEVAFEDLKKSQDFRKMVNARDKRGQPILQVMDESDFRAYYETKAASMAAANGRQVSVEDAISQAEQERRSYYDRNRPVDAKAPEPLHRVVESGSGPQGATHLGEKQRVASTEAPVTEDELIRDKLRILLFQLHQDVLEEQKKSQADGRAFDNSKVTPASTILLEVQGMRALNQDELEHIRSRGYWKAVKAWAERQLESSSLSEESVASEA